MTCQFPNCSMNAVNGDYCIGHSKMGNIPVDKKSGINKTVTTDER